MSGTPVKFEVLLTDGAEQDLESIHDYISEFDCVANANHVLDALMDVVERQVITKVESLSLDEVRAVGGRRESP